MSDDADDTAADDVATAEQRRQSIAAKAPTSEASEAKRQKIAAQMAWLAAKKRLREEVKGMVQLLPFLWGSHSQ